MGHQASGIDRAELFDYLPLLPWFFSFLQTQIQLKDKRSTKRFAITSTAECRSSKNFSPCPRAPSRYLKPPHLNKIRQLLPCQTKYRLWNGS